MPAYYTYFISSLPMLHFGNKPPFSFDRFIQMCQDLVPEKEVQMLGEISLSGEYIYEGVHPALKQWFLFDTLLRNELVKIRASRKRIEPSKYLRPDGYSGPEIAHLATSAYRNPSILEAERMLDWERWHKLDELAVGHYFDMDFLIVYALKLLILERWENIRTADKPRLLEMILQEV